MMAAGQEIYANVLKLFNIPSSGVITVTSVYGPVATVYALMTHSYV